MRYSAFWLFVLLIVTSTLPAVGDDVVNGLKAELFGDQELKQLVTTRIDPNVDWHWAYIRPDKSLPLDHFSIRWSGYIKAPVKGAYKLTLMGDDGFRLYIDGRPVINEWRGGFVSHTATVELTGKPQKITVEYFEYDGGAWITLWWQPLGADRPAIVPGEVLFPDEENANAKVKKNPGPARTLG
ncbi:MAG: PA14 domain-containing protein [Planctomycetota bacterium]|nr:PA14 domain-containing protein [Planctomycetota bacterium]